jgi:hypothetical protein
MQHVLESELQIRQIGGKPSGAQRWLIPTPWC